MSEQIAAGQAPAAPAPAVQQTPAVAAPQAPPAVATAAVDQEPAWLPDRLARAQETARKALLAELGVQDSTAAKAALAAAKAAEEAKKTETEKLLGRITELEPAAKRAADLEAIVKAQADAALASLTPEQREAVVALVGDDASKQLSALPALRKTWATAPAAAPAAPPPANTAPPTAAPSPAPPNAPTNHKAVYEQMRQTNPMQAAQYLARHAREIYPTNT